MIKSQRPQTLRLRKFQFFSEICQLCAIHKIPTHADTEAKTLTAYEKDEKERPTTMPYTAEKRDAHHLNPDKKRGRKRDRKRDAHHITSIRKSVRDPYESEKCPRPIRPCMRTLRKSVCFVQKNPNDRQQTKRDRRSPQPGSEKGPRPIRP